MSRSGILGYQQGNGRHPADDGSMERVFDPADGRDHIARVGGIELLFI